MDLLTASPSQRQPLRLLLLRHIERQGGQSTPASPPPPSEVIVPDLPSLSLSLSPSSLLLTLPPLPLSSVNLQPSLPPHLRPSLTVPLCLPPPVSCLFSFSLSTSYLLPFPSVISYPLFLLQLRSFISSLFSLLLTSKHNVPSVSLLSSPHLPLSSFPSPYSLLAVTFSDSLISSRHMKLECGKIKWTVECVVCCSRRWM